MVKTVTIFLLSDFYCGFLLFSELSNAAVLFVQLTVLVLSLTFSLLFLGEQKNLFKRLEGLKEEVKARLFLATIPLAENTAAVEMRKQLIGITGYNVSTAALKSQSYAGTQFKSCPYMCLQLGESLFLKSPACALGDG